MASDESVIKRRLLIDGDGTGDDRRLNVLLKSFIKWGNTKDTAENTAAAHDRMLGQLAQCEYTVRKSHYCRRMIESEMNNYKEISKAIGAGVEQAKHQIEQSKESLAVAKKIRKNKMEYDVLAKVIKQQPDRKEMAAKLDALKKELEDLKESRRKVDRKMDKRCNDFAVLMRSINELQKKFEVGDEEIDSDSSGMLNDNDIEVMSVDDDTTLL